MSLLSWFSMHAAERRAAQHNPSQKLNQSNAQHDDRSPPTIDFDEIATRFADLTAEVTRLQKQTEDQQATINDYVARTHKTQLQHRQQNEAYESQIKELRTSLVNERSSLTSLQQAITPNTKVKDLRRQGPVAPFTKNLQDEREKRKRDLKAAENRADRALVENTALKQQLKDAKVKNDELKLDIEFLQCTTTHREALIDNARPGGSELELEAPLPDVPFVLVLIDADAYRFAEMLPNPYSESQMHPGARMAHNIKNYLLRYIASHGLPSHCKLIVRALVNGTGIRAGRGVGLRRDKQAAPSIDDFMIRFTEYSPLFEFFDAGQGKERVDGKIHEMYHTFITNPSCHKIFLGVARDNGFARMLEPHIHHPASRAKTCLVSAGDIAVEIQRLDLETVEWPAVFARQTRPKDVLMKEAKRENRRHTDEVRAKQEKDALIRKLGRAGYDDLVKRQAFLHLTKELVGVKSAETIVQELRSLDRRVVGVRTDLPFMQNQSFQTRAEETEVHGHGEPCVEVGVD